MKLECRKWLDVKCRVCGRYIHYCIMELCRFVVEATWFNLRRNLKFVGMTPWCLLLFLHSDNVVPEPACSLECIQARRGYRGIQPPRQTEQTLVVECNNAMIRWNPISRARFGGIVTVGTWVDTPRCSWSRMLSVVAGDLAWHLPDCHLCLTDENHFRLIHWQLNNLTFLQCVVSVFVEYI